MLARLFVAALLSSSAVGEDHRAVNELLRAGDPAGAVAHIERLVAARGAAALARWRRDAPSAFHYLGVAHYQLGHLEAATHAFRAAVNRTPADAASWLHLGDTLLNRWRAVEAVGAFDGAEAAGARDDAPPKRFKARTWMADWRDYDAQRARCDRAG